MTAQLINGKLIAQEVREGVAAAVAKRTAAGKMKPTLATVLVGDRPDSAAYVASKGKACQELGMGSISEHLPANATQEQVESLVKRLNADPTVSGILAKTLSEIGAEWLRETGCRHALTPFRHNRLHGGGERGDARRQGKIGRRFERAAEGVLWAIR